ncbi:MAG: efflux RND transporter periplasmic adaptor subunit [Alphaproteobacteria bacterium]|jgi:RND family efflux transporter MFP subunit|nr:efflux RND transporter periplasmic adaptor subunit [Alphaproteobacteria bacterium]
MSRLGRILAVVVLAFTLPAAAQEERATAVEVDAVTVEPFSQTVPILGRLVAAQRGEVAARVAAAVEALDVQVGDRVAAGDVIAEFDRARLEARAALARARVTGAEAQIAADRAELSLLEQERRRLMRLQESAAFSPAQLEDKRQEIDAAAARLARARAQLEEARADLALAEVDLDDGALRAPYPGVVTERYVSAGDYVTPGEPVVALLDDTSLEIEADVPSARARHLDRDDQVAVRLDVGPATTARLRAIVPDENPLTRTVAVRFAVDTVSADMFVATGRSVTLEIPVGAAREVVTVDKDAVLRRPEGELVFVAADGRAQPRPVTLGDAVDGRFVVEDGLEPGDLVVVRGNERLRPGQPVRYETPPTAAQPAADASAS